MTKSFWRETVFLILRTAITVLAFVWVFRQVNLADLKEVFRSASRFWILVSVGLFFAAQLGCVLRWRLLVPPHPLLKFPFLLNSFLVACFFNTFLPTTVGGDVIRGYDLIKATGEWRASLASVLMDRLLGFAGFLLFALGAWFAFPPARENPLVRAGILGLCGIMGVTVVVLGSRRVLRNMLKPFGKIGLGQLESHARQFQEAILAYIQHPSRLLRGLAMTAVVQVVAILTFATLAKALGLSIPLMYLFLVVPIILTISQVPVSLNGWGIREWATVLFLKPVGVSAHEALSLSLIAASLPLLAGAIGAVLFLARRRRKKAA